VNKAELWKAHQEKFTCAHASTELRERIIRGGGKQYVHQCLRCGDATTNPIKAELAISQNGGKVRFDNEARASTENIRNADDSAFWDGYEKYLNSPEWTHKRKLVLKRSNGICEGCLEEPATQVHHLTYEHVGMEFLFELVAICEKCHDRLHN
jgi:hypothetical protein